MAKISNITTGEQSVSSTGAVTGSLSTAALSGAYTVKMRVRGLATGKNCQIVLEDTANVTPFSDATQPWSQTFVGGEPADGDARSVVSYSIPQARFGVTNSAFRINVQSITSGATFSVLAWVEQ
jgi:hypothetical protein